MLSFGTTEALTRFADTAALQYEPKETFTTRLLIVRLIFSISTSDIDAVIEKIESSGMAIGDFDKSVSVIYHNKGLLNMTSEDWLSLYETISFTEWSEINKVIEEKHDQNIQKSSIWKIKSTLTYVTQEDPNSALVGSVFFAIYNNEVDRGSLLRAVLQKFEVQRSMDVALELLSRCVSVLDSEILVTDISSLLSLSWIGEDQEANFTFLHNRTVSLDYTSIEQKNMSRISTSRPSLLLLRQMSQSSNKKNPRDSSRPSDFPIDNAVWSDLSNGQQNSLLFIGLTASKHEKNKLSMCVAIVAPRLQIDLAVYQPHPSQLQKTIPSVIYFLERAGAVIDTKTSGANALLRKFSIYVTSNILADKITQNFTLPFLLQLYFVAYLPCEIQGDLYQSMSNKFNLRISMGTDNNDTLPKILPSLIQDRLKRWVDANKICHELCISILPRVCS